MKLVLREGKWERLNSVSDFDEDDDDNDDSSSSSNASNVTPPVEKACRKAEIGLKKVPLDKVS